MKHFKVGDIFYWPHDKESPMNRIKIINDHSVIFDECNGCLSDISKYTFKDELRDGDAIKITCSAKRLAQILFFFRGPNEL